MPASGRTFWTEKRTAEHRDRLFSCLVSIGWANIGLARIDLSPE